MGTEITAYKGFDKDLKCRGFQYEIGKEYEEPTAEVCKCGFHACTMPLDVFKHYAPAGNRFCVVEQDGEFSRDSGDSKVASTKIKIGAEIGIPELVKAQIEWVKKSIDYDGAIKKANESPDEHATGLGGIAIASGYGGKAMGAIGCAIVCCERGEWDGSTYPLLAVKSAIVDGEKIKANTWYSLQDGEFVECK